MKQGFGHRSRTQLKEEDDVMGKELKENRGLFFLPMIAEALQKADPKKGFMRLLKR